MRTLAELKALAHPLRMDIAEQPTLRGAMTASELGEALGETPANCSWHPRNSCEDDDWGLGTTQMATYLTRDEAKALSDRIADLLLELHGRLTGDEPIPDARLVRGLAFTSVEPPPHEVLRSRAPSDTSRGPRQPPREPEGES